MKGSTIFKVLLVLAVCLLFTVTAYAEVTTDYGINFRLRQETWDNLYDLNYNDSAATSPKAVNDANFFRLRTQPWFRADQNQFTFYTRLVNEAKYYMSTNSTATPPGLNKDEIDFDNLYVAAKGLLDSHLDLRIGRQDLVGEFGDNFLVVDGTPGDGSRTFYFNAARATVKFNERYNLDLVYLFNQYNDGVLPSLYQSSPPGKDTLNTSDEIGILAYGRGRITDNLTIEPYYMYKDEKVAGYPVAAPSVDPTAYKLGKEQLKLNTVGARVVIGLGPDWTLKGEYAHQFGEYDDGTGRVGDGGNVFVGRQFKDVVLKPSVNLGYVYLSGDKQDSSKVEGWDPLWSRYPWLFEGQGYTYVPETGIKDYYTNLEAVRASFNFVLTPQTGLMLAYNHLWANQSESNHYYYASATSYYNIFSKDGKNRGDLVQVVLSHNFTDKITGFLQVEDFMPGNYYNDTNRDNALFVRWQLEWKI